MLNLIDLFEEVGIVGIGDRFSNAVDRVRAVINQQTGDRIRTLMDMMKSALVTYVRNTQDVLTGREIYHHALKSGSDNMLTVTGAAILANALSGRHKDQAKALMKGVGARLSGAQSGIQENASSGAVSAGAIATAPTEKKKKREDSIFAEELSWDDLIGEPAVIEKLTQIAYHGQETIIENVLVDPTTAELVLAAHDMMAPDKRRLYGNKSISEMIRIAERAVERGIIQVIIE
jgi:hypothetical protein